MQIHGFECVKKGQTCYLCETHQKQQVTSNLHLQIGAYKTNNPCPCVRGSSTHVMLFIMTVLLKNLFTVHFQFDLLKLETNNTRDDILKHAWIIARWTAGYWGFSLTTVATSWVKPHSVWPPSMQYERAPTTLPYLPPPPPPLLITMTALKPYLRCITPALQMLDGQDQWYLWHLTNLKQCS